MTQQAPELAGGLLRHSACVGSPVQDPHVRQPPSERVSTRGDEDRSELGAQDR